MPFHNDLNFVPFPDNPMVELCPKAEMGIEKTTEHESGYFEEEEDIDEDGDVRVKKQGDDRSVSEVSSNNNECDVTISDCSEDSNYCGDRAKTRRHEKGRNFFILCKPCIFNFSIISISVSCGRSPYYLSIRV